MKDLWYLSQNCTVICKIERTGNGTDGLKSRLYHVSVLSGKAPGGLTATQLTELCKEDKAAISRTLSQLSSKGLVSCELPEHKRSYRTLYYLTEEGNTVVKRSVPGSIPHWLTAVMA